MLEKISEMKKSETDIKRVNSIKSSFVWRWTKRIFIGITGLFIALVIAGLVFQFVATKIDEAKYPASGKMIEIGDYRLHLNCTGEGSPTVILDAGLGGGVLDWALVQPEVAKLTRVCSFDHAGAGWSDSGIQPRTSQQIVQELHTLLGNAGISSPYVLVGHSLGGINVQLYASQYPQEVTGMVLVDATHESQFLRKEISAPSPLYPLLIKTFAPVGLPRLLLEQPSQNIPPDLAAERAALYSHTRHMYSVADEVSNILTSLEQLRAAPMQLGNKPLIVLTKGNKQSTSSSSTEEADKSEEVWQELQADLARHSSNGKQVIAENSGHYIQFDQPELVVDAISQVMNETLREK